MSSILYEMKCVICDTVHEVFCTYEDRDNKACDVCGGKLLHHYTPINCIVKDKNKSLRKHIIKNQFNKKRDKEYFDVPRR